MGAYLPPNLDVIRPLLWDEKGLHLLDQRRLPWEETYLCLRTWEEVSKAIKEMVVRGAPAIGITAAIGLVLGAEGLVSLSRKDFFSELERVAYGLKKARPTAVNLSWAVERLLARARETSGSPSEILEILRQEALKIWEEDIEANRRMGSFGAALLPEQGCVLTHCNAGALATGGYGTALGVIRAAVEAGKEIEVLADETRPWLQGARLTAWELQKVGVPVTVIPDVAAGALMAQGKIQAVVVGADRIARNGDVANKIGTYSVAVLAQENGIPFYVAAPRSTIDLSTPSGKEIPIEWRAPEEVLFCGEQRVTPEGVSALNPAFDVTPSRLVKGIITEVGVVHSPYNEGLPSIMEAK